MTGARADVPATPPQDRSMPPDAGPDPARPRRPARDAAPTGVPVPPDPAALRRRFLRIFPGAALAIFLGAIEQTIVATALPAMAAELGAVERIAWVVVSYLVAATVAAPVFGRLGDALGRRAMLLAALALFVAASLLCGLARDLPTLIAGRLLQGLGGGGLFTLAMALIGEAVPARERGRFQGWIAGVFVAASSFGPVAGGWLTGAFGWRAVFLVNLPLGALGLWLALRLPRGAAAGRGSLRFDWPGVVLFAACVTPALLALERVQRLDAPALLGAAGLALVAGLALWALLRVEARAPDPLLPLPLLADPVVWRANLVGALVGAALVGLISFLPVYLVAVRGETPASAGLLLLPFTVAGGIGAYATGRAMAVTGRTMVFPAAGLAFAALVLAACALLLPRLSTASLPWLLGLAAIGFGTSYPVLQTVAQVAAGPERLGAVSASVQFTRSLGAAAGAALFSAVLFAALAAGDPGAAALFRQVVDRGAGVLAALPPDAAATARTGFTDAFRAAILGAALLVAAAAWTAWRTPSRRL